MIQTKLKEYRAKYNMTQEDLAQRVGVRRETIGNLEKGRYNPSLVLALADRPSLFRPHRGNLHHRSIKQQDANRVLLFYVHKRIEAPIRNPPKGPTNLSVPPTRPAGQQVRAAARKKTQRAQLTFPPHRLARQGTPRRVPPAAAGGKNFNHIFPGHVPGKIFPHPSAGSAGAVRVQPQFWEGPPHQAEYLTPPYSALPNEGKSQVPLPKFLTPRSSAPPPYPNPAASSER